MTSNPKRSIGMMYYFAGATTVLTTIVLFDKTPKVEIKDVDGNGLGDVVMSYGDDFFRKSYWLGNSDGSTRPATVSSLNSTIDDCDCNASPNIIYLTDRNGSTNTERVVAVLRGGRLVDEGNERYVISDKGMRYRAVGGLLMRIDSTFPLENSEGGK